MRCEIPQDRTCDYLVIGSGIAGLYFALHAAEHGRVVVLSKRRPEDSATWFAQGGIASVLSREDSFAEHIADTIRVGAGLCHEDTVRTAVSEGPACVRDLADRFGVAFDRDDRGDYDLGREGGHGRRRVAHVKDLTGKEVAARLLEAARRHPNIELWDDCMAIDLLTAAKSFGPGLLPSQHAVRL